MELLDRLIPLIITGIITGLQLYITNKIIPVNKDIESIKDDINEIKSRINHIDNRCYQNHTSK